MEQLKRMAATHGNLAQWKVRAAACGGNFTRPSLARGPTTPLKPILKNKRTYKGYTVEAAAFEARPFLCTATCIDLGSRVNGRVFCVRTARRKTSTHGGGRLRPDQQNRCHARAHGRGCVFV